MYRIFEFFTFGHKITLFFAYTQEKKDFFVKKGENTCIYAIFVVTLPQI